MSGCLSSCHLCVVFFSFLLRGRFFCTIVLHLRSRRNRCVTSANGSDSDCEQQTGVLGFYNKKKRKKRGESCRRDSSKPLYIKKKRKGTYTLRALWPTKREKWVTKKQLPVVAQRMFFFFFFFFLSLIIVRGA